MQAVELDIKNFPELQEIQFVEFIQASQKLIVALQNTH